MTHIRRESVEGWGDGGPCSCAIGRNHRFDDKPSAEDLGGFDPNERAPWETTFTASELMATTFPPVIYVVPGIIAPGLTLLVGAPKLGKSWLAMNIGAAVASGGRALGRLQVAQSESLYLALEDPPRRLQERLRIVLEGGPVPAGLNFATEWPLMHDGGADQLDQWLREHPGAVVFVDVLAKVRGTTDHREARYDADYRAMNLMKQVADRHNVAIVVVHHTRKAASEDFVDSVSGTNGLAGAADTIAVLARSRGSADATLEVTGRDVSEAKLALGLTDGRWTLLDGPADDYELGETRRRILSLIRGTGPKAPKAVASLVGIDHELAKKTCQRMAEDGQLVVEHGTYSIPVPPVPLSPDEGQGDTGDRDPRPLRVITDEELFAEYEPEGAA